MKIIVCVYVSQKDNGTLLQTFFNKHRCSSNNLMRKLDVFPLEWENEAINIVLSHPTKSSKIARLGIF